MNFNLSFFFLSELSQGIPINGQQAKCESPGCATINDVDSVKGRGSLPSEVLKRDRPSYNFGFLLLGSSFEEALGSVR